MASPSAKVSVRVLAAVLLLLAAYYVGRPLYWKLSATIHEIRHKNQTVQQGISQIVMQAQKSVGWIHDESDSGVTGDLVGGTAKTAARRVLRRC